MRNQFPCLLLVKPAIFIRKQAYIWLSSPLCYTVDNLAHENVLLEVSEATERFVE
jgi:hypothetical protein